ncbi:MAG: hypothetical protein ACR2IF_14495 [Terriglobales bacterium]
MPRIPSKELFLAGISAYEDHEGRGTVYFDALKGVQSSWGDPKRMAGAVWVLLNSWHRDFYRFGAPNLNAIAACIQNNLTALEQGRPRTIESFSRADELTVKNLFREFLNGTHRENTRGNQSSPVAVAKTLNLMNPSFLPLWDNPIAGRFGYPVMSGVDYVSFCWDMVDHAAVLASYLPVPDDRSVLKRIDEFNYSAYTKGWVAWR